MRVLVTGGSGFLGTPTIEALKKYGSEAVVASRASGYSSAVVLDIANKDTWHSILACRPDRLIHLAWDLLTDFENPRHYCELLPQHTAFLIWCVDNGIRDITVAGTLFEYGLSEGELKEDTTANPLSAYGIAKDSLRRILQHYTKITPFILKWARIFYTYEEAGVYRGVFKKIVNAIEAGEVCFDLTSCEQMRDYIPRTEIGEFLAAFCMQSDHSGIVNCCSGKPRSMRDIIVNFVNNRGYTIDLRFGRIPQRNWEPHSYWGNRELMDNVLVSLRESVKKTTEQCH